MEPRTAGCVGLAVALLVGGTFGTGLLPGGLAYQLLAGGAIVAAFAVLGFCFRE